jgi:hypothetical protein
MPQPTLLNPAGELLANVFMDRSQTFEGKLSASLAVGRI